VDTEARILATFEHLIETRPVADVTVSAIAREAGCSMSSLYARFPTKDALIEAYFDDFFDRSRSEAVAALGGPHPPSRSIEGAVRRLVEFLVRGYRRNRGALRALIFHDRQRPDSTFGRRTRALKQEVGQLVVRMLVASAPPDRREHVLSRAGFALWLVDAGAQHAILLDKLPGVEDPQLERELTTVLLERLR
jgi:AcrR family transcriptional regulator